MNSLKKYDVIVLGAGAAGLFCAFTAAQRGRQVLVLEKSNKVGKKILMSGGGRCNFTNYTIEADHYISANPHFCKAALKRFNQWEFIALVERHKIAYEERKHGQLFCLESAKDILDMLLVECNRAGVDILTHCAINSIENLDDSSYSIKFLQGSGSKITSNNMQCESLVVASGALSIPSLGGSSLGYDIAAQFSLPLLERRAGLVPFMFSDEVKVLCERLAGVSVEVEVYSQGQGFRENMLFTHRGLSGPVILQISNYWLPGNSITINLLPDIDACDWLLESKGQHGKLLVRNLLSQKLGKSLVRELQTLWWQESSELPMAEFSDKQLTTLAKNLNGWQLKPSATEGYRTAEVTLGGVDTDAISSKTMEVKQQSGLYFIGEVLDVTGHLGGYNFQWAWSSGYSAGLAV